MACRPSSKTLPLWCPGHRPGVVPTVPVGASAKGPDGWRPIAFPSRSLPASLRDLFLGRFYSSVYTIHLPHACENPSTTCSQFADDTALISIARTLQDCTRNLQQSVTAAGDWLQRWHLLVNTKKTVILPFYHNNRPPEQLPQITLRNSPLTVAQKHKHLGIIFQHDLRWTEHVEYIVKKSLKSFNILFRLRSTLTSDSLSHIYQTYITTYILICEQCSHTVVPHFP